MGGSLDSRDREKANMTTTTTTPEAIEALFRRTDGILTPREADLDEDEEVRITEEEWAYRISKLRQVLLAAQTAWVSGSEEIDAIAEKLGDGSRDRE